MIDNLSIQYPSWYIIFCGILALVFTTMLYYRDKKFSEESRYLPFILAILRFLIIGIISFFLLSPFVRNISDNIQKPIIVVAKDISSSIVNELAEEEILEYNKNLDDLAQNLQQKYEVETLSFGTEVSHGFQDSFTDKICNISKLIEYIDDNYADQNLGAIVISTDGIYNEGKNPVYSKGNITSPIYTVAMGDTTVKTDLTIKGIFSNNIVYLGDKFSIQVDIKAYNSKSARSKMTVQHIKDNGRETLNEDNFLIDSDDYFTTKEIVIDTEIPGINRYRVNLSPISGEISRANNVREIYVQVLDARQKILILAQSPHPDLSALSQIITSNKNYEVDINYVGESYNVVSYDQVIFHNLPGKKGAIDAELNTVKERKIPHIFIVGSQMNIAAFNAAQDLIEIKSNGLTLEEINPSFSAAFKNFTTSENLKAQLVSFPPLIAPFGEYSTITNASSFLFQNIKSVETDYPLISFQEKKGLRSAVIVGEGIWKWRLFDYLQHGTYDVVNELVNKTIQYISTKKDNRKFITSSNKNLYKENEGIRINAQFYNDNYELVNEPEVFLSVFDSANKEFKFTMTKTDNYYVYDLGQLSPGNYRYSATTNYNGLENNDSGKFAIKEILLESFDLQARHNVLASLSGENGELVYPDQIEALGQKILEKETIKPVIYQNVKTSPLIDLKWIFFLLLGLISTEWIMRRYFGSY